MVLCELLALLHTLPPCPAGANHPCADLKDGDVDMAWQHAWTCRVSFQAPYSIMSTTY